jgi:hypothetical protein
LDGALKKRAERFGLTSGSSTTPDTQAKKKMRAERFSSAPKPVVTYTEEEREKMRKRAERFGMPVA